MIPIIEWPTKKEAADALGVSTKTLEKYVQAGRLEQRMQSQINKPPRAVINPDSLQRMFAERSSTAVAVRSETTSQNIPQNLPSISQNSQSEKVLSLFSELQRSHWPPPLFLTVEQAILYSGLSAGYLDRMVREGKLRRLEEGIRGYRYRRADLDAL